MASAKLKPEFKHALASIDNALPNLPAVPISSVSCSLWTHDKFSLFDQPLRVRRIPAGKDWRWNQTKCKKTRDVEHTKCFGDFCQVSASSHHQIGFSSSQLQALVFSN